MAANETVFITGFPGFIASRLLQRLAYEPFRFLLLVQPALLDRARAEVEKLASQIGRPVTDFHLFTGDISQPNLGLAPSDFERARKEIDIIYHLAAVYDLAVKRDVALQVNVGGTRNVNDLARAASHLQQYHYVSTCYVAGKRRGRILETQLEHSAGFRNHYEETKHLAEIEVEKLKSELPVTIHRPAVVCGDSHTGETVKYDGIYYLINYLLRWPSLLSFFNIGNEEVCLNLVPVDFVVQALAALAKDRAAVGKTLQLADPYPLSTYELFNRIAMCINGRGSRIKIPARTVEFSLMLPMAPAITHLPHHAVPYFFLKQTYDTIESSRLLAPHSVFCPSFPMYAQHVVEFAARHPMLA
jgi:thioester reductase-like protein